MDTIAPPPEVLDRSLELPCGATLKNRIAKSAMSDSLADGQGEPTAAQIRLYERWAEGGLGLSIIGEVQGDPRCAEKPGNLVLGPHSDRAALAELARRGTVNAAHLWTQLGHAGALAHPPISEPKGPSPLDLDGLQCAGLTGDEVGDIPRRFARTALRAREAGFTGVQIHAAHGFLLSQFLSPLFNRRTDGYGGSIEGRSRLVREAIDAVRAAVGPGFPIGIKLNATDMLEGGLTMTDALEVVRMLDGTSVDLIDVSGGTYFPGASAASHGSSGQPYFLDFAERARTVTAIPLMTTGGFRSRAQAGEAVASGATDLVGLARALVLDPELPATWLTGAGGDPPFPRFEHAPPGGITAWYTLRLTALGEDREADFDMEPAAAIREYERRDEQRCALWNARFGAPATVS